MTNIDNSVMDWNDVIEDDGQEFVLLPEGDYNFVVTNFERGRFPGSAKIPATNKATISIQIFSESGVASMKFDLILSKALTWKLSAFFRSIGQKKVVKKTLWIGIKFLVQKEELILNKRFTPTKLVKKKLSMISITLSTTTRNILVK